MRVCTRVCVSGRVCVEGPAASRNEAYANVSMIVRGPGACDASCDDEYERIGDEGAMESAAMWRIRDDGETGIEDRRPVAIGIQHSRSWA